MGSSPTLHYLFVSCVILSFVHQAAEVVRLGPPAVMPDCPAALAQQLVKGLYAGYLPAWWAVWPRERLLLLRTEDYKAAPQEHLQAVSHFLGESQGGGRCGKRGPP